MFENQAQTDLSKIVKSNVIFGIACLASISFPLLTGCRSQNEDKIETTNLPRVARLLDDPSSHPAQSERSQETAQVPILSPPSDFGHLPETKASLVYRDRLVQFTAAQSPQLFSHSQRLEDKGICLVISVEDEDSFSITACDQLSGYRCGRTCQISKQELFKVTREKGSLPEELSEFLESFESRGSLLVGSKEDVSDTFYRMTIKGASLIPDDAVTFLQNDGWIIIPRHSIAPNTLRTEKGLVNRMPAGRCNYLEKRIELGEFFSLNASVKNASVASLYHEIGHAIYYRYIGKDPTLNQRLTMAMERDLSQLGDLTLHVDPEDPELSLKLSYYGNVSEGFAESYKNMLCPSQGKGRIMHTHFPTFYSVCEDIISNLLTSHTLSAAIDQTASDR